MSPILDYLRLCWFKGDPAGFSPSARFLGYCVAFYLVSGIIVEANISDPADATLEVGMRALVALTLLSGMAFFFRQWQGFKSLLASVFMSENVIITWGIGVEFLDDFLQNSAYADYPFVLGIFLLLWYLAIIAYVFRKMFKLHSYHCTGLAVGYFLLTYGVPFLLMEAL